VAVGIALAALVVAFLSFAFGLWQSHKGTVAIRQEQTDRKDQIGYFWASEWARQRPVVYPVLTSKWLSQGGVAPMATRIPLKNGGRGPALNVGGVVIETEGVREPRDIHILAGTIAAGDEVEARLPEPGVRYWQGANGTLEYTDLVGGSYTTPFTINQDLVGTWAVVVGETVHTLPPAEPALEIRMSADREGRTTDGPTLPKSHDEPE
jgi:hypothetical protein